MQTRTIPDATSSEPDLDEGAAGDSEPDAEDSEFDSVLDDLETLQDFQAPLPD